MELGGVRRLSVQYNGLWSAINVSKCGHNVTGALSGCRFQSPTVMQPNLCKCLGLGPPVAETFRFWVNRNSLDVMSPSASCGRSSLYSLIHLSVLSLTSFRV